MQMDLAGFAVSSGSACSSGKVGPSRVLRAMGFDEVTASSATSGQLWARRRPKAEVLAFADTLDRFLQAPPGGRVSEMENEMNSMDMDIREGVERETVEMVRTVGERYKYGWESDIETEYAPKGLNEDIVKLISEKKNEPAWMLEWRWPPTGAGWKWTSRTGRWSTIRQDRFSGAVLLRPAEELSGKAEIAR